MASSDGLRGSHTSLAFEMPHVSDWVSCLFSGLELEELLVRCLHTTGHRASLNGDVLSVKSTVESKDRVDY